MRATSLARTARRRHKLEPPLVGRDGTLDSRDAAAARRIAARLNEARAAGPEPPVGAGDVTGLAVLDAILHRVVERERSAGRADLGRAEVRLREELGDDAVGRVAQAWRREFRERPGEAGTGVVGELLILAALNENPAAGAVRELVDDRPLRSATPYDRLVTTAELELGGREPGVASPRARRAGARGGGRNGLGGTLPLPARLREPMTAAPGSLAAQLQWIRMHWADLLAEDPSLGERLALAIDVLAEERRAAELRGAGGAGFGGPIPAEAPDYRGLDAEPEAFSADTEWMPSVVLVAKSTYVWLEQLSARHGRWIRTLADVPDEALDGLAAHGITGLWLIGLWQRSRASAEIKRRRGDAEAVASAYSIDEYRIADDLGGEAAYASLRERATMRGIRMAADMVPNHMGIDSSWVVEHPEWFIGLPDAPYPAYSFDGPNLSPNPGVEITLEDHYWNNSDAAVVFRRRDTDPARSSDVRFIYHGNDGTSFPWNDTAQLDYLDPAVREAVIRTILDVARRAPIIRFDAAMVLARRHIRRLWYPKPGEGGAIPSRAEHALSDAEFDRRLPKEFWREVVDRVAAEAPGTLLLAEAFWLMEGYFVRTLGMHRVYNSAFMHMLRDEDNAGYRRVMKETLEFDPRVLQRFVNFMTNPDEKPAAEQYGTGEKAFAAATLLATLPGLPMLGHGQVEGFRERYGHEFRKARWDEPLDQPHLDHWERTIVPLLRRRAEFSGTERFHLYDATGDDGSVVEDVYAFSNASAGTQGDRHSLVLIHHRQADVDIAIDHSAAARQAGGAGRLIRTRLASDLDLPDDDTPMRFRDPRTGWETIRAGRELHDRGLRLHLGPYEAVVLDVGAAPAAAAQALRATPAPSRPRAVGRSLDDLPEPARAAAVRFVGELRQILGQDLVAAWVHGGTTFDDRPERPADLDIAAVIRNIRPAERWPHDWRHDASSRPARISVARKAIGAELGVEIDSTYLLEDEIGRGRLPSGAFQRGRREHSWPVFRAHWLAGQYVSLYGPSPADLVTPPTDRELRHALDRELEHLERHVAEGDANDPFEATYAIWNGARILRTLATGNPVISKRSAGAWALTQLPVRWHPVIEAAGRTYDGRETDEDRRVLQADMAPYVAMVREALPTSARRSGGPRLS